MNNLKNKPPVWFWVISVFALLWNISGVLAYLADAYMSIETLEQMTHAQRLLHESQPAWVTGAFAIAVFTGLLGSVALLIRKKWAKPILLVSLLGIIVQHIHTFFMTNALEVLGTESLPMSIVVFLVGVGLVFFAKNAIKENWLV